MPNQEVPMTMHVAVCAEGGGIALVGDRKVRTTELVVSDREPPSGVVHRTKIAFSDRHDIAVAMAGDGRIGSDVAGELASFLSSLESPPDFLSPVLANWGNAYFDRTHPGEAKEWQFPLCSLMVVTPHGGHGLKLWKVRINKQSSVDFSDRYMVCGNEENPAIFWLEYLGADKRGPLGEMTGAATMTVASASKINPYGVGGLDVHQFRENTWRHWTPDEVDAASLRMRSIDAYLCQESGRLGTRGPASSAAVK